MSWSVSEPVIVPVDFSGMSVDAVSTARKIAEQSDNVYAVHVVSNYDQIAPGTDHLEAATDDERRAAVRANFAAFLDENGFGDVREIILEGEVGEQIAEYAASIKAGLVVISSHGYDGVKRMLLGSVAESIIREIDCAVLVLRRADAE